MKYHPGLNEAIASLDKMPEKEILDLLDSLFGRDRLKYGDGIEELHEEARRQLRIEFTVK